MSRERTLWRIGLILWLAALLIAPGGLSAQEATPEPTPEATAEAAAGATAQATSESTPFVPLVARMRPAHFVPDLPALRWVINGLNLAEITQEAAVPIGRGDVLGYIDLAGGTYTFSFVIDGQRLNQPVIEQIGVRVQIGREYTLAAIGSAAGGDLRLTLIDETALLTGIDEEVVAAHIVIHNLPGVDSITALADDEAVIDDLPYGEAAAFGIAADAESIIIVDAAAPDEPLAEIAIDAESPPGVRWLHALTLDSPTLSTSEAILYSAALISGEEASVEAGTIAVGEAVPVTIDLAGQRVRFELRLDEDAVIDIVMTGGPGTDAYLYVYDDTGALIAENDEISFQDAGFDAGLFALDLAAGDYIIEAASWNDAYPGRYQLSVRAADE
jgi:hypothetical protein